MVMQHRPACRHCKYADALSRLLGRHGRSIPRELDFEESGRQEGPFRTQLWLKRPLPRTARGNEYLLVMVDQFTKWVECIPVSSQTAEVTAKAAVNKFFARFGCPFQIFTDRGRNFERKLFRDVYELLQVHKACTAPYRP